MDVPRSKVQGASSPWVPILSYVIAWPWRWLCSVSTWLTSTTYPQILLVYLWIGKATSEILARLLAGRRKEVAFLWLMHIYCRSVYSPRLSEAVAGSVEVPPSPQSSFSFSEDMGVQFHNKNPQLLQDTLVPKDRGNKNKQVSVHPYRTPASL